MEIFYLLIFALAITAPIFYLWGLAAFIQTVFGDKNKQQSTQDDEKSRFVKLFFQRVEEAPDLSLQDFLEEVRGERTRRMIANQGIADTQAESIYTEEISDSADSPVRLSDLVASPTSIQREEPQQGFSWSAWYADHSIDFILYLGAFMIVAAVSLFVGFQWGNFDGLTRFGIVVVFTIAWYVAGFAVQRFLSLDAVAIAFITIGAIITPFCGVAWQRFVIGSMDNFGITWLITSLIGTVIYVILSLVYQRRHFTYFGNLSILASILAIVQVTESPQEYFILAGTLTALVLLSARVAMKTLAPRLDAYLGQDFEWSSLAILLFSIIAGLMLLSTIGLAFFSVEVLAVMIGTMLYACLYLTIHFKQYTIALVQALLVATLSHALMTFDVDRRISLYIVMLVAIAVQFAINYWLKERQPEFLELSNALGLLISGIVYVLSIVVAEGGFIAIPALIVLIGHATYYAIKLKKPYAWYLVSILFYPLLAHILIWLNVDSQYWTSAYVVLGILQVLPILTQIEKEIVEAFAYLGLIGMAIAGFVSLSMLVSFSSLSSIAVMLAQINPFVVLAAFAAVMLLERGREGAFFAPITPIAMAGISILYYIASVSVEPALIAIMLALSVSVLCWIAQSITGQKALYFVVFAAPYFALYHSLLAFDTSPEIYPIAYAILSALTFFAIILPDETDMPRQVVSIVGLALVTLAAFAYAIDDHSMTMHYAGWLSSYTLLVIMFMSRSLLGKDLGNAVFAVALLLQYYWHIIFLQEFVNVEIFGNVQWFSAPLASLIYAASIVLSRREMEKNGVFLTQLFASAVLMLPTLGQILDTQSLLYFGLGVIYSLIIAAIAISFSQSRMRTMAVVSLVLVVLCQSSEFLLSLPRWIVIGVIGFGLIGAGLYLSIRRRAVHN